MAASGKPWEKYAPAPAATGKPWEKYAASQATASEQSETPAKQVSTMEAFANLPYDALKTVIGGTVSDVAGGAIEAGGRAIDTVAGWFGGQPDATLAASKAGRAIATNPESRAYTGTGPMALTTVASIPISMGAGGAVKAAAPLFRSAAPTINALGRSIQTGGFDLGGLGQGSGAANFAIRQGARAAGGAGAMLPTAAVFDPNNVALDTLIGAGIPIGVAAGGVAARKAGDFFGSMFAPERTAANALVRASGGDDLVNMLQGTKNLETTPGFVPTFAERQAAFGQNNPTIASLEQALPGASNQVNREIYDATAQRVKALQDQITRISDDLRTQANALAPNAAGAKQEVLASLQADLQATEAILKQQQTALSGNLGSRGQVAAGEDIAARGSKLKEQVRKTEIQPAYTEAFTKAGNTPINIESVVAEAESILGRKISDLATETSATAREILKLRQNVKVPKESPGQSWLRQMRGEPAPKTTTVPDVTLQQLDDVRKAINFDMAAAKAGNAPANAVQLANMSALHSKIDDAVANSNLSAEAKAAYSAALTKYRTEFVPQFKTGLQIDLLGSTRKNVPRLIPDNVTSKIISNESGVSQFRAMFKGDPQASKSLQSGIEDLYERQLAKSPEAAESWLTSHKKVFDDLEAAGVPVRQNMAQMQQQAQKLAEGYKELNALRTTFGDKNPDELIDTLMSSSANLEKGLSAMGPSGRLAFGQEVSGRAMDLVNGGNTQQAIKYLTENKALLERALTTSKYKELMDTANWAHEVTLVGKQVPKLPKQTDVTLSQNYTPEQLTDLQLVANDLRRARQVETNARFGSQVGTPNPEKLASEAAAGAAVSAAGAPTMLSTEYTVARQVWKQLEGRVNARTAAVLARWMYQNPDAAIEQLTKAQARAKSNVGGKVGKAVNRLAIGAASSSQNALAEP
jgi:hypothetical protein